MKIGRIIRIITNVLFILLTVLIAVMYLPIVAGYKSYRVLSASMEPEYPVGSLVYVKQIDESEISPGDVITFYINESTLVTHRVIEKASDDNGFITKGDANNVNDGGVAAYSSIVGKAVFDVPFLGYVSSVMCSLYGKCIVIGSLLLIASLELLSNWFERMNCRKVLQ